MTLSPSANRAVAVVDGAQMLLAEYDRSLPQVYGYLLKRCGDVAVAEDLTSETYLAAVAALRAGKLAEANMAWLIGVARHKLMDHWRKAASETRKTQEANEPSSLTEDPWETHLVSSRAQEVLGGLAFHHRSALSLRYIDDLPVKEVAQHLGRSVQATETLLVRARKAFRELYETGESPTTTSIEGGIR